MKRAALLMALQVGCSNAEPVDTRAAIDAFVIEGAQSGIARIPARAEEPVRISASEDAWVEVTPLDVRSVPGAFERGAMIFRGARTRADLAYAAGPRHLEELWVVHESVPRARLRWHLTRGPGIASIVPHNGGLVARDAELVARLHVARPFVVDAAGVERAATLTIDGDELELTAELSGLRAPIVIDPVWSLDASMAVPRTAHTATALGPDVLVIGGVSYAGGVFEHSSVERYDSKLRTFVAVAPMSEPRLGHTTTAITGALLVAGGSDLSTAERFDTATSTWRATAPMNSPHRHHIGVALSDGRVLVAGGAAPTATNAAEIYNPATNAWTAVPPMSTARRYHRAVRLNDGRVLVAGGLDTVSTTLASTELYNPSTNTWSAAAPMAAARERHELALLPSGKVLAFAGSTGSADTSLAEIYDPATNAWTATAPAPGKSVFGGHLAQPDGSILAILSATGGTSSSSATYSPSLGTWSSGGLLVTRRQGAALAPMLDGVIIIGGTNATEKTTATTESSLPTLVLGAMCAADSQCLSRKCVSGVCCAVACGACEECRTTPGTCTPLRDGPSAFCPLGRCVGGICDETCLSDMQCASNRCVDGKCVARKKAGEPCGDFRDCSSSSCIDGVCCDTPCLGPCGTCNAPGALGTCTTVSGPPARGTCPKASCGENDVALSAGTCTGFSMECARTSRPCAPFACRDGDCLTTCTADADCARGLLCVGGACHEPRTARCNEAGTHLVDARGVALDCAPYLCSGSRCTADCGSDKLCRAGMACVLDRCEPITSSTSDSAFGCGLSTSTKKATAGWVLFIAFALARRRRAATLA